MRVKDAAGNVLSEIDRTRSGLLSVISKTEYEKYKKEKEVHTFMININNRMELLEQQIAQVLQILDIK